MNSENFYLKNLGNWKFGNPRMLKSGNLRIKEFEQGNMKYLILES